MYARPVVILGCPVQLSIDGKCLYKKEGESGRINKSTAPKHHPNQLSQEVIDKVIHLRRQYPLGPIRIIWYMERYHDIHICDASVYRVLYRHRLNRLPRNVGRRKVHTNRYEKQVPGHYIQVDVTFLKFID